MTDTTAGKIAGNNALPDPPPVPPAPPRVPRTHINPNVIQLLKQLPLYNKLEKNKQLESDNLTRSMKMVNHSLDPLTHLSPGSDCASLITIGQEELSDLLDDTIRDQYKAVLPLSITKWLAEIQRAKAGESHTLKRPVPSTEISSNMLESRVTKRHCMDGSQLVPCVIGVPADIIFPQILFDTEGCVPLPLPFFLHKNLHYIIDNAAMLPTVKSNPLDGATKGLTKGAQGPEKNTGGRFFS